MSGPTAPGGSTGRAAVAVVLGTVGVLALAFSIWSLVALLPAMLGADGTHMAQDTRLAVVLLVLPLACLALVLAVGAWALVRRRRRAGVATRVLAIVAGLTAVAAVGSLALPVLPAEAFVPQGTVPVRVAVTGGVLTLTPASAPAGRVYLLFDESATDVIVVGRSYATEEEEAAHRGYALGPLSDTEVEAIARGDRYLTSTIGGIGDVAKWSLLPGKYVFMVEDATAVTPVQGGTVPANRLAVLTVTPVP